MNSNQNSSASQTTKLPANVETQPKNESLNLTKDIKNITAPTSTVNQTNKTAEGSPANTSSKTPSLDSSASVNSTSASNNSNNKELPLVTPKPNNT